MPGIGKSSFVFVLLWALLHKCCWNLILLKFKESDSYYAFDKDGKVSSTVNPAVAANWVEAEEEGKVWYLADWKIDKHYWSLPCKYPKAEVDERFDKWGGVPRHVLSKTGIHQQQELEDVGNTNDH
ncbi:hypothetical protein SELMODRAFT_406108 [Selaginella moellendorffii]|uniref:Uncharacterized protein n=1 Tax=Selaginella moellendorffii TaxID=88036 RepID=D8R0Q5_SELML|nr:hypothetical protein SELMODRAFT_406108 [Selaginella moellendorffii]